MGNQKPGPGHGAVHRARGDGPVLVLQVTGQELPQRGVPRRRGQRDAQRRGAGRNGKPDHPAGREFDGGARERSEHRVDDHAGLLDDRGPVLSGNRSAEGIGRRANAHRSGARGPAARCRSTAGSASGDRRPADHHVRGFRAGVVDTGTVVVHRRHHCPHAAGRTRRCAGETGGRRGSRDQRRRGS